MQLLFFIIIFTLTFWKMYTREQSNSNAFEYRVPNLKSIVILTLAHGLILIDRYEETLPLVFYIHKLGFYFLLPTYYTALILLLLATATKDSKSSNIIYCLAALLLLFIWIMANSFGIHYGKYSLFFLIESVPFFMTFSLPFIRFVLAYKYLTNRLN